MMQPGTVVHLDRFGECRAFLVVGEEESSPLLLQRSWRLMELQSEFDNPMQLKGKPISTPPFTGATTVFAEPYLHRLHMTSTKA
jgi:hypothetical protein